MISVLVVDDHPVVLTGLAALVGSDPQLSLVGTARSVTEARELDPDPAPAVAVLDLQLPDGDGISLGIDLKRRWPDLRVLILTMNADEATVIRSLASGLDGYLLKDADPRTSSRRCTPPRVVRSWSDAEPARWSSPRRRRHPGWTRSRCSTHGSWRSSS